MLSIISRSERRSSYFPERTARPGPLLAELGGQPGPKEGGQVFEFFEPGGAFGREGKSLSKAPPACPSNSMRSSMPSSSRAMVISFVANSMRPEDLRVITAGDCWIPDAAILGDSR